MPRIRDPVVPAPVASAAERLFAALSAARGRRIFHPQGIAYGGTLSVEADLPGVPLLVRGAAHPLLMRFSRALGTPRGRPDFLGLAMRVGDEQDLLLASSSPRRLLRLAPLPARTFAGTTFSSLLPFDAGGRAVLVAAQVAHVRTGADDQLVELEQARERGAVRAALAVAELGGRWRRVGAVEVGRRLSEADAAGLAFDPWVCGGGLVPRGRVNAVRGPAYRGSRRGRGAAAPAAGVP